MSTIGKEKRFVLEAVDPVTGCIARDHVLTIDDMSMFVSFLHLDQHTFDERASYPIESEDLDRLEQKYGFDLSASSMEVWLRSWIPTDGLPYKVHTNRELVMMLNREKPLAAFSDLTGNVSTDDAVPEHFFESHVSAGTLVKREHIYSRAADAPSRPQELCLRHVFYALPGEEWRINAYILMFETAEKSGWSEGFERMQGALLGYEPWQIEVYIRTIYQSGKNPTRVSMK